MIPFAIMCGRLRTTDGTEIEIRVLDLSLSGFTFRLPIGYFDNHGKADNIKMSFWQWSSKTYETVELSLVDANENEIISKERLEFYDIFRVNTCSEKYRILADVLTKEYMNYIRYKLECSDSELTSAMTGRSMDDTKYASSVNAALKGFAEKILTNAKAVGRASRMVDDRNTEFCISLENRRLVGMFLEKCTDEFVMSLFKRNYLEEHPFSRAKYTRLYVGNSYCCNQYPNVETVRKIAEKACECGMNVTVVIAPVPESRYIEFMEYIDGILRLLLEMPVIDEICVNDLGMFDYVSARIVSTVIDKENTVIDKENTVRVTKGILLSKSRRDPRSNYLDDIKTYAGTFGDSSAKAVFFPYYQVNTGTFCTLFAAVNNGGRGNQCRVNKCSYECEKYAFLYPDGFNMIGRYNSLFGAIDSERVMFEPDVALRRVVVNLWD